MSKLGTVLVTGAAGYIGSRASTALRSAGYDVIGIDNFSTSPHMEGVMQVDVRGGLKLDEIFRYNHVDHVMHFAGLKNAAESGSMRDAYYANNVLGTRNLLESMDKRGVRSIIFSSSAAVYGKPSCHPTPEGAAHLPINYYGYTKWKAEQKIKERYLLGEGWSVGILRYFNVLGGVVPHDNSLADYILRTMRGEQDFVTLYGDGMASRDFVHIDDIVRGHIDALEYIKRHESYNVWNLGSGEEHTVEEVVTMFEQVFNTKIPRRFAKLRPNEVIHSRAMIGQAHLDLGWKPKYHVGDAIKSIREVING